MIRVPYGMTVHGEEEIKAVEHVLRTSTQMGRHVRDFEKKVSSLFHKEYGVMLNSGSSALLLSLEILELPEKSQVITPVLTFSTTVAAILKNNLIPAFVDVEPNTFCIDVEKIEEMITPQTKAMCVPNLLGNIARWPEIRRIADQYDLKLVEDSADTLGGLIAGKPSGFFSDISITSFYGSHIINCAGNGGLLALNNKEMYRKSLLLRSWGRSSSLFIDSENIEQRFNAKLNDVDYDSKFIFEMVGYNFEPSEMGAAFGLVQLKKLNNNIDERIKNFKFLYNFFSTYTDYFDLPLQTPHTKTGWLAFPIVIKETAPFSRKDLQIFLENRNIQTRVIFTGNINVQPGFSNIPKKLNNSGYPCADNVMRGGMLLACHHGLNQEMKAHMIDSLTTFLKRFES